VAPINRPVLLIGERGTGKELAAARLHYLSGRWERPFVTLNCASLAPTLIEAELFGYERGAFTGALQRRPGRFESAEGGTLFLDEIGNVPLEVQGKILRVVEYNSFERVGSAERIDVDVRIVAATNADLRELVRRAQFKPDLLDRLSFEVLVVPPLRARRGDVLLLARHFAARMAKELGRTEAPVIAEEACRGARTAPLARQRARTQERRGAGGLPVGFNPRLRGRVRPLPLPACPERAARAVRRRRRAEGGPPRQSLKAAVWALQVRLLEEALGRSKHNQRKAAADLGLTYNQFRGLYRRYQAGRRDPAAVEVPG
jgi:psp operon transcriptional activator